MKDLEHNTEYALLGGVQRKTEGGLTMTFEAGPSYVSVKTDSTIVTEEGPYSGPYPVATFTTAGLALQSQMFYRGFGLVLFGNINSKQSFAGAVLAVRFGRW